MDTHWVRKIKMEWMLTSFGNSAEINTYTVQALVLFYARVYNPLW